MSIRTVSVRPEIAGCDIHHLNVQLEHGMTLEDIKKAAMKKADFPEDEWNYYCINYHSGKKMPPQDTLYANCGDPSFLRLYERE